MKGFLLKKLISDLFTDPEELLKSVLIFVAIFALLISLIFLPVIFALNVPSILFSTTDKDGNSVVDPEQLEIFNMYSEIPMIIEKESLEWVEEKKMEYAWCDEQVIVIEFDLQWQHLMAMDSVLFSQDFYKVQYNNVMKKGKSFIIKKEWVEEIFVPCTDDEGNDCSYYIYIAHIEIRTRPFEDILTENKIIDQLDRDTTLNIYEVLKLIDNEGLLNIYDDIDLENLKIYPSRNDYIPYYHQGDRRWALESYGSSTIISAGCGPTALAMVLSGLTGNPDINPKTMADWSMANGHRAEGAGSFWTLMTDGARAYGVPVKQVSRKDPNSIIKALERNHPVIVSMGKGDFTNGGHFIVLKGITSSGKIEVYDPSSENRTDTLWDLSTIMTQSSSLGGKNGNPFWVYG